MNESEIRWTPAAIAAQTRLQIWQEIMRTSREAPDPLMVADQAQEVWRKLGLVVTENPEG